MFRRACLFIAAVACLARSAFAQPPTEVIPFSAKQHVRTSPPSWAPDPMSAAQMARLNADLADLDLPVYAVLVSGEELEPAANLVDALDRMISGWQQQGLSGSRYVIFMVAWSKDCGKPKAERRPGHNRCEYALSVGWSLRRLGIQPAQNAADLAAPYLAATSETPIDMAGGILKTLQGIADLERQKESWVQQVEDGSRPRAQAALDGTILLANHLRGETASPDETLNNLINQAVAARDGSIQRISAANEALQTYLNSLIRIGEAQRNRRARSILELGTLLALFVMAVALLGLGARKRWDRMKSIANPVRAALRKMREHVDSILRVTSKIEKEWGPIEAGAQGKGPETTMLVLQTRASLHDLRAMADALNQHVLECENLLRYLPYTTLLRALSPCPAQALDRHMRKAFPTTLLRPNGYSLVVGSDLEVVRMTHEEAEKRCELLHAAASAQMRALRDATNTAMAQAEIASWCSEQRLSDLVRRADSLGVPSIWYLSHPLRNQDPKKLLDRLLALYATDPTAAVNLCVQIRVAHEEVSNRVEAVGTALAKVAAHRVRTILFAGTVQVDADDDPRQTISEATKGETLLARLCDSPENPEDASVVEAQASAVIRLYKKALSQYETIRQAQAGVVQSIMELQEQIKRVGAQIGVLMAANGSLDPSARTQVQLGCLHMQAATREIQLAAVQAGEYWFVQAQRSAQLAKSELDKATRCAKEAEEMQIKTSRVPEAPPSENEEQSGDGGSGSGGGSSGGGGSGSGGGSSGGGGSGSGGGSSGGKED